MDLREIPPQLIRISLPDQTSPMGTTNRIMEDHMVNVQISRLKGTVQTDLEMDLSTIKMETGEKMALHRLKGETSHKVIHTANQEVMNLAILSSADLTIDLRLVLRLENEKSHKTITRRHFKKVRFTTTDNTINELSELFPLN